MKNQRFRKKLTTLALLAAIFVFTGCYGSFTLTKKIYNWNGQVGEPVVN